MKLVYITTQGHLEFNSRPDESEHCENSLNEGISHVLDETGRFPIATVPEQENDS